MMNARKLILSALLLSAVICTSAIAQETIYVRPVEIDDVLINPGMGFMTFQRFNGDALNEGIRWTEGLPIEYQDFDGNLENEDHPMTSIAYFRVYWKFMEPEMYEYNWKMIDKALKTARERKQTLLLRIAPYGSGSAKDVPDWYRAIVGDKEEWLPTGKGWRVDAEDQRYAEYFGKLITELGKRYDGHPDLEAVDLSIVGFWGEGRGSSILTDKTRAALVNAYTDNFKKTPLIMLMTDEKTNKYILSQANAGWRVDCIGDLGFWADDQNGWTHMYRYYPQGIINFGMKDAWKTAPVSLEICGTMKRWKQEEGYTAKDIDYIIDETLKWHISSFNAKSSSVPPEWKPQIDRWLKKMGYRFVLRSFSFPEFIQTNEKLIFKSWWENNGVSPCYKKFILAIRLKNKDKSEVLLTDADIRTWLPGDNMYDSSIFIPSELPTGNYELQIGIVDRQFHKPKIKLAIEGKDDEGWYTIGNIRINK